MNTERAGIGPGIPAGEAAGQGSGTPASPRALSPLKSQARNRRLHAGHFAFMRSVVQGLDTRDSWDRYLRIEGEHGDIRNVNRAIAWIRDEFAAAARRHDRPGIARLVRIDARRLPDRNPRLPTLEQFAQDHGLQDFSQREQIEYYESRYGKLLPQQSRRARLIARQLDALDWLERLVAQPPQASDRVASWLHPDLAAHLERAGIFTVRQLNDRINGLGMRWWTGIRAIGAGKAGRIMDWLAAHEATTGLSLGAHVNVKRSQLDPRALACVVPGATAIVPIDKLVLSEELDGSAGRYRAPQASCLIDAKNDREALFTWVKAKRGIDATPETEMQWLRSLSHTQRAYLKEAERFMLWAIVQHKKPLSSITLEDCEAYRSFLVGPTPADRWCGPRGRERWSPLWRPFEGPLSPRAQQQAITILKNLYKFLTDRRYLTRNPWVGVALPKAAGARSDEGRSFTHAQWNFIEARLDLLPDTSAHRRLRFALHLLYATGLRLAEVVAARVDHLNRTVVARNGEPVGWELTVPRKGEKQRLVPVPPDVIDELSRYLGSRGFDPAPEHEMNRGAYLLGKAVDAAERAPWSPAAIRQPDPKGGIAAGRLYKVLKAFFSECANALAATDPDSAERLAAASTQWLRNTHRSQRPGA